MSALLLPADGSFSTCGADDRRLVEADRLLPGGPDTSRAPPRSRVEARAAQNGASLAVVTIGEKDKVPTPARSKSVISESVLLFSARRASAKGVLVISIHCGECWYTHIHVHMNVYVQVRILCTCTRACTCTCTCTCTHTCVHVYVYACVDMCACTRICTCTCAYACDYSGGHIGTRSGHISNLLSWVWHLQALSYTSRDCRAHYVRARRNSAVLRQRTRPNDGLARSVQRRGSDAENAGQPRGVQVSAKVPRSRHFSNGPLLIISRRKPECRRRRTRKTTWCPTA